MKCLIVEDDVVSRHILSRFLSGHFDCDSAVNGEEAVLAFRKALDNDSPYDLICMDIMMQKMDGQEALRHIREIELERHVTGPTAAKVIMTTTLNDPKTVMDIFCSGGATAYLVKPVTRQKLLMELRKMALIA